MMSSTGFEIEFEFDPELLGEKFPSWKVAGEYGGHGG